VNRYVVGSVGAERLKAERSFVDVFGPHVQPGYRLACAMLHDPTLAEDIVQEACLIAWTKRAKVDEGREVRSWFLRIVANECRNARRRRWFSRVSTGLTEVQTETTAEEHAIRRADLSHAIQQLAHEDRLIVVLFFYLDMPLAEVAAVTGTSVAAARSRLYRAIHRIRPDVDVEEAMR
jgi:RNA polymerase sigma-70 factor (ECF subfamily)